MSTLICNIKCFNGLYILITTFKSISKILCIIPFIESLNRGLISTIDIFCCCINILKFRATIYSLIQTFPLILFYDFDPIFRFSCRLINGDYLYGSHVITILRRTTDEGLVSKIILVWSIF